MAVALVPGIHPEWQQLAIGDSVKYWMNGEAVDAWTVAAFEPNRFLGLHGVSDLRGRPLDPTTSLPKVYTEGLWGFQLRELPAGGTRLVIGGYEAFHPPWLEAVAWLMFPPMVWAKPKCSEFSNETLRHRRMLLPKMK